jgi:hypothetical protein
MRFSGRGWGLRLALALILAAPLWAPPSALAWTPPDPPDPEAVLAQARKDVAAHHDEDALAELNWFHEHALDTAQGLYGLRLTSALKLWSTLAQAYPPALIKLQAEREAAAAHVRSGDGARGYFNEVLAIDRALGQGQKTGELFAWLDTNRNETASQVYDLAQPALVRAKNYTLCGKYLQPQKALQGILDQYRLQMQLAGTADRPEPAQDFARKTLVNRSGILVGLLVQNHRREEADAIAGQAIKAWDDPSFREQLLSALSGDVPEPWPL